jgi:hypothetical protein
MAQLAGFVGELDRPDDDGEKGAACALIRPQGSLDINPWSRLWRSCPSWAFPP